MDIAAYYSDPAVRQALLHQLKDRDVLSVQKLRSGAKVYRRNVTPSKPIHITQATGDKTNQRDLAWFTDRRFAEFHPVVSKKTDEVWVDIDPGPQYDFEELKKLIPKVEDALREVSPVDQTQISFSGGRGFHVRGKLTAKKSTNDIRRDIEDALKRNFKSVDGVVFTKPKGSQVRLDTSTLKDQGSIRAIYSLNADTGNVAVPLTERELRGFKPEHASVKRILKEKEFAPGIPRARRTYALPNGVKDKIWTMSVQEHDAQKAGKHWDLRLVDPATGYAHSWAVPKAQFPVERGKPLLAVRTPTHTSNYALNFGDKGPRKIGKGYGKGVVEIKHKEPIKVEDATDNKVVFSRFSDNSDGGERYTLFKAKDDTWLIRRSGNMKKEGSIMAAYDEGYVTALRKLGMASPLGVTDPTPPTENKQPLEVNDDNVPAGQLASIIANIPPEEYTGTRDQAEDDSYKNVEDRLNRAVSWGQSQDIPIDYTQGASTTIPGGGF